MRVRVELWSNRPHLQQLLTGLHRLHHQREIRLEQHFIAAPAATYADAAAHLVDAQMAHCRVVLADGRKLYFDLHDSHEIHLGGLDWCDVYYKRGFIPAVAASSDKVRPYGLNYLVYDDQVDWHLLKRQLHFEPADWPRHLCAFGGMDRVLRDRFILPRLSQCEQAPTPGCYRTILFQTRLWDPAEAPSAEKASEWQVINEFRVDCVRALKLQFPQAFRGGIAPSAFAQSYCDRDLLCDAYASQKVGYFKLLREPSIAVSSAGLHQSNGWKLPEYLAFSKPIIAEPPVHTIPGGFEESKNCFYFQSVDSLLQHAQRLLSDTALADAMAQANWTYYQSYMRPEIRVAAMLGIRGRRGLA
ncbi:glycosyltransferase [Coraliomargarita algicola]|uniref:Glycosyltransferase n=1 Tax=Coraliomargarita algicola TaxID=3092156 RepID=A0ABZ0RNC0_9BACT|nr:glycosyltransferase [Coraliomargarita sp. J2-16]WPJ97724.1 glycosyltransferase [Coraliomargarita sp. J2-16]